MPKQKSLRFEVDQSIRIEETNKDTVIGISNKQISIAMILPRKTKRHFMEDFRRRGISKRFGPVLFAVAIIATLKKSKTAPSGLILDIEYPGYERLITKVIGMMYPQAILSYRQIGKGSPAHEAAYFTHTRKRSPDGKITRKELEAIIKKTTGGLLHFEFTKIRSPRRSVNKKYTKKRRKSKGGEQ